MTALAASPGRPAHHVLSVLVENRAGVLARVASLFARRGFNIDSLVVSEGRNTNFSRMTIGVSGDPQGLVQIIMQVSKLIDVIHCSEHHVRRGRERQRRKQLEPSRESVFQK